MFKAYVREQMDEKEYENLPLEKKEEIRKNFYRRKTSIISKRPDVIEKITLTRKSFRHAECENSLSPNYKNFKK